MMKERIAKNGIAYVLQEIVGACILFEKVVLTVAIEVV